MMSKSSDILPVDYPLPNLYYFSSDKLQKIKRSLETEIEILKDSGFQECHFPFLVPKAILTNYPSSLSTHDLIKVFSGKDRRSYAYLRPDAIFSQGTVLAKRMIKSYKDLPLKLFEMSPSYTVTKNISKIDPFNSPEQSFSIQAGVFTENIDFYKDLSNVIERIFERFAVKYVFEKTKYLNFNCIEYSTKAFGKNISLARILNFDRIVTKKSNIYCYNKEGKTIFPYMFTFSLSQNLLLIASFNSGYGK